LRVAENHDNPVALLFAHFQATAHQGRADALILAFRQDSHRSERQRTNRPGVRDDGQVAEQDVANDLLILLSNHRGPDITPIPKGVHQPGFIILSEGKPVHLSDSLVVSAGFR
jgi:hypothetical protein